MGYTLSPATRACRLRFRLPNGRLGRAAFPGLRGLALMGYTLSPLRGLGSPTRDLIFAAKLERRATQASCYSSVVLLASFVLLELHAIRKNAADARSSPHDPGAGCSCNYIDHK